MSNWFQRNRHLYPYDWPEISYEIKWRDRFKCKFCSVPDKAIGYRDEHGSFHSWANGHLTIHLTVAHLGVPKRDGSPGNKMDKSDCRPENLAALCQKCHLRYDIDEHVYNSALTRRRKHLKAGQMELGL